MALGGDVFGNVGGQLASSILGGAIWVIVGMMILGVIVGIAFYLRYRRQFDINAEIISEREGNKNIFQDKAGILRDRKTNTKYMRLLKTKVDLPVPPYSCLIKTNKGDQIKIWRKSEDEFIPLKSSIINKGVIVRQDGKVYNAVYEDLKQVEGDVAYWNVKRKQLNKSIFDPESVLMKLLPYIPHIIGVIGTVFLLYILLDSLPQILQSMTELTSELRSLKGAEIIAAGG